MKSIKDTLQTIRDIISALPDNVTLALVGGYAVILQGVERTTLDIDFCLYTDLIHAQNSVAFFNLLKEHLPERFSARLLQGSKFPDDPFKHDVIVIEDTKGEYIRIDFLIAHYKWELEGIRQAERFQDIPVPVLSKPYLAAMKLRASGFKDANDVVELVRLMTPEERAQTQNLAKRIGRDKKLAALLSPPPEELQETPEEYIS
jgi:hypothetical protein